MLTDAIQLAEAYQLVIQKEFGIRRRIRHYFPTSLHSQDSNVTTSKIRVQYCRAQYGAVVAYFNLRNTVTARCDYQFLKGHGFDDLLPQHPPPRHVRQRLRHLGVSQDSISNVQHSNDDCKIHPWYD